MQNCPIKGQNRRGNAGDPAEDHLSLHCIMMLRNERDIIMPILNHATELFDQVSIVDIQSTDGTLEAIRSFTDAGANITLYTCRTQERFQAAMMNRLAEGAVAAGADWVFFLDGDEFIDVENRSELRRYLLGFPNDVMHMSWVNLVPETYGVFDFFEIDQKYFWTGCVSPFRKIALSSLYIHRHNGFFVHEGNHGVSPCEGAPAEPEHLGLNLLHLPVRSADRLKYKQQNAIRLLESKHNTFPGEGVHASKILAFMADGRLTPDYLNTVASNYGVNDYLRVGSDPSQLGWPTRKLPSFVTATNSRTVPSRSLGVTLARDDELVWRECAFAKNSLVGARIEGAEIVICSQPMTGAGERVTKPYTMLPAANPEVADDLDLGLLLEMISASFQLAETRRLSGWSKLVPVLFALFVLLRPRRYVELGTFYGMSFFAACQISRRLDVKTRCVAVDTWIGDAHSGVHSSELFHSFRDTIRELYPDQHYIQGFFSDALPLFEDRSIDLLHIDGYHIYDAVKTDFETWLPKMSNNGVIIFHDISVHEREFSVWRFWKELLVKYPGFGFEHCHGLGILYVGSAKNAISKAISALLERADVQTLIQHYFERMGELVDRTGELAEQNGELIERNRELVEQNGELVEQNGELIERMAELGRSHGDLVQEVALANARATAVEDAFLRTWKERYRGRRGRFTRRADTRLVQASGLFDAAYYLEAYPDVRTAGVDPLTHFVTYGAYELRNPSPRFNTRAYVMKHLDALGKMENPLVHYIRVGKKED
jgi:hypothetical protein